MIDICGNNFVSVIDISKVYIQGEYIVGEEIEDGEYYFWGDGIYINICRKKIDFWSSKKGLCIDDYYYLYKNNKVIIKNGFMTSIDNIKYSYQKTDKIIPGHVYRVEKELPIGYYEIFYDEKYYCENNSDINNNKCTMELYVNDSGGKRYCANSDVGYAEIDETTPYVIVKNGYAIKEEPKYNNYNDYRSFSFIPYNKYADKRWENLRDKTTVFQGEYVYYYFSINNPLAEIVINNYFVKVGDVSNIDSINDEDFSRNLRVMLNIKDIDNQCILLYMFMSHLIQPPSSFGVFVYEILSNFNDYNYNKDPQIEGAIIKVKNSISNSMNEVFDYYSNKYPYQVLYTKYYYVKYIPHTYYYKYIEDISYDYLYYYMSSYNSLYEKKYNKVIHEMAEQGLVRPKWKSEFALYMLVKSYFSTAEFQYHSDWLDKQSLDVFVPEINIAFEYQGVQHYEAVDIFGGTEGFNKRKKMDDLKREKCNNNNIKLVEWKYSIEINDNNLMKILKEYDILIPRKKEVVREERKKVVNDIKEQIYQYDLDGNFISAFVSIKEAEKVTGMSSVSIQRACRGFRNSAGGFQWRRVPVNTPKLAIEALKIEKNKHTARKIIQYDKDHVFIKEYKSIAQAVRETGINSKSIRDAACGKQNHAGGYCWKYKQ